MQIPKIGVLRDNGSDSYGSYWYDGSAHWPPPPPAETGDPGGKRGQQHIASGVWGAGLTFTPTRT